jgi:predicted transcriptional regulator
MTDVPKTIVTRMPDSRLGLRDWQVAQIERSMAEMDAGQGILHENIEAELSTWGKDSNKEQGQARQMIPR